jgi:molybdopterin synthase sulfur carrier subunit
MATVWVPSLIRDLTGGKESVSAPGKTVGQVIAAMDGAYPGIKGRLCQGDRLDPAIVAYVDGRIARLGLSEVVEAQSEIHFLPVVAGG